MKKVLPKAKGLKNTQNLEKVLAGLSAGRPGAYSLPNNYGNYGIEE